MGTGTWASAVSTTPAAVTSEREPIPPVPRILVITKTPPGTDGVGQIILRDLCAQYPAGEMAFFVLDTADLTHIPPDDGLGGVPVFFAGQNRYHPTGLQVPVLRRAGNFVKYQLHRLSRVGGLIREACTVGCEYRADMIWAVLDSPMVIHIARAVAERLGVPLLSQVWDPPDYLCLNEQIDAWSAQLVRRDFGAVLRASLRCAVVSEAMQQAYRAAFGVETTLLHYGLERRLWHSPAPAPQSGSRLTIGFAGSPYAKNEWRAFIQALNGVDWRVGKRTVTLRLLGPAVPFTTHAPAQVEFLGWRPLPETIKRLAEADVLYLPYWFDSPHRSTVRYSFPTKVPTYLAAGRPILYHGPRDSSVAHFFSEHPVAASCHSLEPEDILKALRSIIEDEMAYRQRTHAGRAALEGRFSEQVFRAQLARFVGINQRNLRPISTPSGTIPTQRTRQNSVP